MINSTVAHGKKAETPEHAARREQTGDGERGDDGAEKVAMVEAGDHRRASVADRAMERGAGFLPATFGVELRRSCN
jgi:hypothetical protein